MINVAPGATFEATTSGWASGLTGTIGVRVLDNVGGTTIARTTLGITELVAGSGVYVVTLTAPGAGGQYSVLWDDGLGNWSQPEDLVVATTLAAPVGGPPGPGTSYLELQNGVLERFEEADRAAAKRWLNLVYAWVMGAEEWTFRIATDLVSVTSGSQTVGSVPADLGPVLSFQRADGEPLEWRTPKQFFDAHYDALQPHTAGPDIYTRIADALLVGPSSDETRSDYQIVYERRITELAADADVPLLPAPYHWMLVPGAQAVGQAGANDPSAALNDQVFARSLDSLRTEYLAPVRGEPSQWGRVGWDYAPFAGIR